MLRNFFSSYYWVTWIALSLASGLFLLESFRVTQVETTLIILPKTETARVAPGNAVVVARSSQFAAALTEAWQEKTEEPRSSIQTGSATLSATLLPDSSAVRLWVTDKQRSRGEELMKLVVKALATQLSQWYSLVADIDLRVIDGPTTTQRLVNWPGFLIASFGLAFAVTTTFFLLLSWIERLIGGAKPRSALHSEYHISPETFRPSVQVPYWSQEYPATDATAEVSAASGTIATQPFDTATVNEGRFSASIQAVYQPETLAAESVFQEEVLTPAEERREETPSVITAAMQEVATGKAPDNLPIMDDLSPLQGAQARLMKADIDAVAAEEAAAAEQALTEPAAMSTSDTKTEEPTQAEYKRRLNELLAGRE